MGGPDARRVGRAATALVAAVLALGALGACGTTPPAPVPIRDALLDPSPSRRTEAVVRIARTGDRSRVPDLIELLDDPDPAVRMAAGGTLRDLTGRDTGYAPWADEAARRHQVEAWRAWWRGHSGGGAP